MSKANYRLTRKEVISNISCFQAAGYEMTSTALAYAKYALARHPEVLYMPQAEIDQLPLSDAKIYRDYDTVTQMHYMNVFISKDLRMYPNANAAIQRVASGDTIVQGIKIKKGNRIPQFQSEYSTHRVPKAKKSSMKPRENVDE